MKAIEDVCLALAIFGLAVAAGWWALGVGGERAVSGVMVVEAGHE